jgi:hypothetical protein
MRSQLELYGRPNSDFCTSGASSARSPFTVCLFGKSLGLAELLTPAGFLVGRFQYDVRGRIHMAAVQTIVLIKQSEVTSTV